jgi:hypothetical protein
LQQAQRRERISPKDFKDQIELNITKYIPLTCSYCDIRFSTPIELEGHKLAFHICRSCGYEADRYRVKRHLEICLNNQQGEGLATSDVEVPIFPFIEKTALRGYVKQFGYFTNSCEYKSFPEFMDRFYLHIRSICVRTLSSMKCFKVQLNVHVTFVRLRDGDSLEFHEKIINSSTKILINRSQIRNVVISLVTQIDGLISIFEKYGSNWILDCVNGLDIRIGRYRPFNGACFVKTPFQISNKRCTVNVKNNDNKCFMWAILSVLHPPKVRGIVSKTVAYKDFVSKYDFTCIKYPVNMTNITHFEKYNSIAVNVFNYTREDKLLPLRISDMNYMPLFKTVNLLFLKDENSDHGHFVGIKDIDRLLGSHNNHRKVLCFNCLNRFSPRMIEQHMVDCFLFNPQKVEMPKKTNDSLPTMCFKNFKHMLKRAFVAYCDFECFMKKRKSFHYKRNKLSFDVGENSSFTNLAFKHEPTGYCFVIIDNNGKLFYKSKYRGKNAVGRCLEELDTISKQIFEKYTFYSELEMSYDDEVNFANSTSCYICEKEYQEGDVRVRDHDHLVTGKGSNYRGSAHAHCNSMLSHDHILPIFLHNFKNYDSHLLLQGFSKYGKKLVVVPNNSEKFLSIQADKLLFLDSMQFLPTGLDSLVKNLAEVGDHKFQILKESFGEKYKYLMRKGVFPYEYIDGWERFKETKFPKRRCFYSSIRDENVAREDYKYGKYLYRHIFKCKDLGDWHDIYLETDTLLLACVFEDFRNMAFKTYGLDPSYYYSSPGYAMDCALKITNVKLELLTNVDDYIFIEKGMRGGVSMIPKRRSNANNKYMKTFDPKDPSKFLIYWDFNNLYGWAMSQPLPEKDFRWLSPTEIENFIVEDIDDFGDKGYVIECDLSYEDESLHNDHNDFPLAPERILIEHSQFGEYQNTVLNKLSIHYNEKQKRLIPHLGNRKEYVVHFRNLKFYLKHGMKLTKIHRVLSFHQSTWLSKYIMLNTTLRAKARNNFEKDFFKGMNNFIFGKTCENKRNRLQIKLTNSPDEAQKLLSKCNFDTFNRIRGNLYAFSLRQKRVKLDRPCYLGFSILDLSKLAMYEFHYEKVKQWYGENASLCMTDTDSLLYEITTEDLYKDLKAHTEYFDFSDYPPGVEGYNLHSNDNKKMIGKMKDEMNGKILSEFVGLQAKAYSTITESNENKKAAKGIVRSILRRKLKHFHFVKVFEKQVRLVTTAKVIRSKKHKLYTTEIRKSGLHAYDSKRFIMKNGINTLSWGHYKIKRLIKCK